MVKTDYKNTEFLCSDGKTCPDGFQCVEFVCKPKADGGSSSDAATNGAADALTQFGQLCNQLFATVREYQLCEATVSTCKFFSHDLDASCEDVCESRRLNCAASAGTTVGNPCSVDQATDCSDVQSTKLCTCSLF